MLGGVNIGKLDTAITVEWQTQERNSIDENEPVWATYGTIWGMWDAKSIGETFEASQEAGTEKVNILVRYDALLNSTMRVKRSYDSTYFYVRSVERWKRERFTILTAERRDNQDDPAVIDGGESEGEQGGEIDGGTP